MIEKLITIPTEKQVSRDQCVVVFLLLFFFKVDECFLMALNLMAY